MAIIIKNEPEVQPVNQAEVTDTENTAREPVDEMLVESIWQELNGRVDKEQISQLIIEAEAIFEEATIKTYVPIFVRRHVLRLLK